MVRLLFSVFLLFPALTFGQVGNAQIQGVCQDTSGAVIPGAMVTIKNSSTGTERAIVTNEVGRFVAPAMQVGTYEISVDMPGMARLNRSGITLNVGAVVDVVLVLQPSGVQQEVSVTAASPIVESTKTEVSTTINEVAIQNLPLNGRRWENLALLTPGTTNDGTFGLVSFRGISGNFNNTMIDGADNNQSFFSESKGRTRIAYSVSQATIREFQVNTSNFSAEFGRAAGGVVNAVTQSGTNEFHASGFYFLRDKSFLALDPFAKAQGQPKPPERRHQFGGSVGGPIVENKLFFFASYDQQNRNFPITVLPNGGERFYTGSTAPQAATDAALKFVRDQTGVFPRKGNQNLVFGKIDWNLSPSNRLASSFNLLRWRSPNGIQTGAVVAVPQSSNGNDGVHDETFINTLTSVLSNHTVNEARFHYGRDLNFQSPNGKGPSVTISFSGNSFQYGMPNFLPRPAYPNEKRFQFMDNLSHVVGKHNLKFGADVNHVRTLFINLFQGGGVYAYNSLTNWIRDHAGIADGANTGKHYSSYSQAFDTRNPDGRSQFAATEYNFYAQDSYQVHAKVTLNLGVRYEYQQIPQPAVSNPALPDTATLNQDKNNWAPRFGLAWQALSKTLFRVGYGISYGRTEGSTVSNFHNNNGLVQPSFRFTPATAGAPVFPNVFSSIPVGTGAVTINLAAPDFVNSMIHGGNVEIEHELTNNLSIAVRYLAARGTKLPTARDANIAPATQSRTYNVLNSAGAVERTIVVPFYNARINPAYSSLQTYETVLNSWYHAGVIQVNKRFSGGLQFMSYFQWAHAIDNGQTSFTFLPSAGAVLDPFNRRDDYGSSNFDQRKRVVFNGIWDMFSWTNNKAVNGFKLSGVLTLSDGFAQTGFVSVPGNLAGGLGSGLNASNATSNRFPGLGRNSFVKPGLANVDLRLAREFKFAENQSVEFIWEAFNVANRVNYNFVNATQYTLSGTNLTPNAAFLTPQSALSFPATGNPRQMQIALKYKF